MTNDAWDPAQYERFREQRMAPFFDLLGWIQPVPGLRVIDLGCGTGELTARLAAHLIDAEVVGVDNSAAMLARATTHTGPKLTFRREDIAGLEDLSSYGLVFSHAALQWLPDHEVLIPRLLRSMPEGAQLAVQMPNNYTHPSHVIAAELAQQPQFCHGLGGYYKKVEVLRLERYAEILYAHGFRAQHCVEKVYGHELASTEEVVEWVRGTLLTAYLSRLSEAEGNAFVQGYRERVLGALGAHRPYFYPFRRMLLWARKGA